MRHWLLVSACAVLGAVLAVGAALQAPASYTVRMELFLASNGGSPQDRLQNGEYVRTRMTTYAGLVTSPVVLDAVRSGLGIPADERLVDDVSATNPLDTVLIQVTVVDSSAERAEAVAHEIARVADPVIGGLEAPNGGSPARVTVVGPPVAPLGPDGPSTKLFAAVGLLMGMVVGVGAGLLRDIRAKPRRSPNGRVNGVSVASAARQKQHEADVGPARGTGAP